MAKFTTRVELHDAQYEQYETLHEEMKDEGFSRLITSDDGVTYHLPWAEYNYSGSAMASQVLEKAKRAVMATGRNAAILVTESAHRTWSGLTTL